MRDLFTEKVLSRWNNFTLHDLFMIELSLFYIIVIWNLLQIFKLLDTLNQFLPSRSSMWKLYANWNGPSARAPFTWIDGA